MAQRTGSQFTVKLVGPHIRLNAGGSPGTDAGVPFNKWRGQGDNAYRLDSALSYPTLNLAKLDELWVDVAKRRGEVKVDNLYPASSHKISSGRWP